MVEINLVKQILKSNNQWLWAAKNFSNIDLFEGLSQDLRKRIYNAAVTVKNVLFETDFEEIPENFEAPIGRMYEAVRGYANRYHNTLDHPLMPSTVEVMFIICKILYRTEYLKVA